MSSQSFRELEVSLCKSSEHFFLVLEVEMYKYSIYLHKKFWFVKLHNQSDTT